MSDIGRVVEISIYSLLDFLPFLFVILNPFKSTLRFSKACTNLLIFIITVIQILLGLWNFYDIYHITAFISTASTILYATFYFIAIKDDIGKSLFTLLMITNVANLVVMSSKCLEQYLFGKMALQPFRWSFSVCMAIVELIVLIPLYFYMKKVYVPDIRKIKNKIFTRWIWVIPATFYLIWNYILYQNQNASSLKVALKPSNIFLISLINIGAFITIHIVITLLSDAATYDEILKKNHFLKMQTLQYNNFNDRIEEARKARHDLKHHMAIISGLIDENNIPELKTYVSSYIDTLPDRQQLVYCKNNILNTIIVYYAGMSIKHNTEFDIKVNVPESITIKDNDIVIIFGNLLENAVYACSVQKNNKRSISLKVDVFDNRLMAEVSNTFENNLTKSDNGKFFSTKHEGEGIGVSSAESVVNDYGGSFKAVAKDDIFDVSLIIDMNDKQIG